MKILLYGLNFHPELTGTGKYTGELAFWLAGQGETLRVVTALPYYPRWKVGPGFSAWRYTRQQLDGISIYRCPVWVPARPNGFKRLVHLFSFALFSLPVMLAQAFWKPDVILCVVPTLFSAPAALAAARLCRAKTWLHIQDLELDAAYQLAILPGSGIFHRLGSRLERAILARFDHVSTISGSMRRRILEKGVPPGHVSLLPNWVDAQAVHPLAGRNPLRRELGLANDLVIILYHGSMGLKQGLEILVDAACHLQDDPRLLFLLCGEGPARAGLERLASGAKNLRFLDLQPVGRLNLLLNLADVHVLPQRAGAADIVMPSKLTSMLASGRPVVATAERYTELGRVVGQVGLLVPPGDSPGLAESIRRLARDPRQRARLGDLGRAHAMRHMERQVVLRKFIKKLHQIIEQ